MRPVSFLDSGSHTDIAIIATIRVDFSFLRFSRNTLHRVRVCFKFVANLRIVKFVRRANVDIYRAVTHGVVDDSRERERCNFTPIITSLVLLTNSGATVIINFACVPVEYAY